MVGVLWGQPGGPRVEVVAAGPGRTDTQASVPGLGLGPVGPEATRGEPGSRDANPSPGLSTGSSLQHRLQMDCFNLGNRKM